MDFIRAQIIDVCSITERGVKFEYNTQLLPEVNLWLIRLLMLRVMQLLLHSIFRSVTIFGWLELNLMIFFVIDLRIALNFGLALVISGSLPRFHNLDSVLEPVKLALKAMR